MATERRRPPHHSGSAADYLPASANVRPEFASNRRARSRSTVTERALAGRSGEVGPRLDLQALVAHLDVDHRPVTQRLEPIKFPRRRG